jgi:hypothetical protein
MVLSTLKNIRGKVQDYVQDKAMDHLLRNTIIYNVAWEVRDFFADSPPPPDARVLSLTRARALRAQDPRVDGKVLKLGPEDRLLMLTTGGCNVMDRLLDGVAHIVSVDLNPSQNALLELRLAAARSCTHEQFFQLFAHSNRRLFDALYPQNLRPLLSPSAQAFWDDNQGARSRLAPARRCSPSPIPPQWLRAPAHAPSPPTRLAAAHARTRAALSPAASQATFSTTFSTRARRAASRASCAG